MKYNEILNSTIDYSILSLLAVGTQQTTRNNNKQETKTQPTRTNQQQTRKNT